MPRSAFDVETNAQWALLVHRRMTAEARRLPEALSDYEVLGESASGEIATVTVRGLGSREEISLRRFGEGRRIIDAPGLGL